MHENAHIALLPVGPELTVATAGELSRDIERHLDEGCRRLVLNLAGCTFVDSAGMGAILGGIRRLRRVGGMLALVNVGDDVYRLLRMLRLVDVVPVRRAGERPRVPDLAPGTMPLWCTSMPVDARRLSEVRQHVGSLLAGLGFSADDVFDMELACAEALGNAIDHASDGCGDSGVLATVTAYPDRVVVDVEDHGCGFELGPDEDPPASAGVERGRGIRLMRLLADSVSIRRRPQGRGTIVRLVKMRPWAVEAPRR